jgi:hypothetical protein
MVDLAIALSIDRSSNLAFDQPLGASRQAGPFVTVLDGLDVSEIPGQPI